MKALLFTLLIGISFHVVAQQRINPIVKNFGGIFDIPYAEEKPDPSLEYNIVIEIQSPVENPDSLNFGLHNVSRLLNLHAMGGVPKENIHVVLAIHGGAAFTVMDNDGYKKKYGVKNPNLQLYKELEEAGVKIFVCGQSLIARKIDRFKMVPEVKIATSFLTTVTTYQLKGYAVLRF